MTTWTSELRITAFQLKMSVLHNVKGHSFTLLTFRPHTHIHI